MKHLGTSTPHLPHGQSCSFQCSLLHGGGGEHYLATRNEINDSGLSLAEKGKGVTDVCIALYMSCSGIAPHTAPGDARSSAICAKISRLNRGKNGNTVCTAAILAACVPLSSQGQPCKLSGCRAPAKRQRKLQSGSSPAGEGLGVRLSLRGRRLGL